MVPGDPEKSLLIQAVRHTGDVKMPPKESLSEAEITTLTDWVKSGAPWPEDKVLDPARMRRTRRNSIGHFSRSMNRPCRK